MLVVRLLSVTDDTKLLSKSLLKPLTEKLGRLSAVL